ncbi:hypothetical protein AOQ84DRAFT_387090 [Glonium stellatum]|uniref:NACHT-NTPase and P-loop NTPases N-terminal domain-containing protein n=1 Tax=Glonium stellatum TaxID=574774 RepID=A0A8E2F6K7_9PEZI|nr:hypothetical protein AOQ84DRAFT_387090 [Glonium stellatum]
MVLEAFAAIGLASNVVQFVDFSSKLVKESSHLYHSCSGASDDNLKLEEAIRHLETLSGTLTTPHATAGNVLYQDNSISELALMCKKEATRLITALEELKVTDGPHRKWRSIRQALRSVWRQDGIKRFGKRLSHFQNVLTLHLIRDTNVQQSSVLEELRSLEAKSTLMNINYSTK